MKRNISQIQFKSIVGWRGDSLCCPQAFGGDIYSGCSMGCWWCFCREMEEGLYNQYYSGWNRNLVRPCDPEEYRKLFDAAFGTDKNSQNWFIRCLRRGLPFNMGSKAETFCAEDLKLGIVEKVLALFHEYKVPVIFQTKSHYIGLRRYLDIIKELNCVVIISIMGGTDTLNYELEPGAPCASSRWYLAKHLKRLGIKTKVRWEPILPGINSSKEVFNSYAEAMKKADIDHVSYYNYRTSNYKIAMKEFESRGFNYVRMLEKNQDEFWEPLGRSFLQSLQAQGRLASSPDFVNFPLDNDCVSCCGVDGIFPSYDFHFQYACKLIKDKGSVSWEDMEEIDFKEPKAYERARAVWNGKGHYYSLADSPHLKVIDRVKDMNVYGAKETKAKTIQGFLI